MCEGVTCKVSLDFCQAKDFHANALRLLFIPCSVCALTLSLNSASRSFRLRRTSSSSSSSLSRTEGGTMREHTRYTLTGSSFRILTTSLCVTPMRGIPFTCQEDMIYILFVYLQYIVLLVTLAATQSNYRMCDSQVSPQVFCYFVSCFGKGR